MLKALEIVGFKSFADRTRFEFPPGITVVVGPNGSGKSNIVDAIKWVLGEQSVKSLRGREMADVIFNGSGSRQATEPAEITLTFDNSKHLLPVETPEVHITRRVYRSGEGEYLINRNPARLRDIRDMLSGTGMGTQAYSVIEQGKVDVLLQSSARDRRVIFEEAAGISRFKMRKVEALRRLERVEQNLLRLSDIVDEVENRLRGVRTQAGKARRYKEHADRLQELRTQVGQVDWKRLTERLAEFESELQSFGQQRDAAMRRGGKVRGPIARNRRPLERDQRGRSARPKAQIAANRERIAAAESTIDHERRRGLDLEQEIARYRRQLVTMSARAGDLQQQLQDTTDALQTAEGSHRDVAKRLVEAERGLTEAMAELDQLRGENEQRRAAHLQQMRLAAALGNEIERVGKPGNRRRRRPAALRGPHGRIGRRALMPCSNSWTSCGTAVSVRHKTPKNRPKHYPKPNRNSNSISSVMPPAKGIVRNAPAAKRAAAERAVMLDELVRRHEGLSAGRASSVRAVARFRT